MTRVKPMGDQFEGVDRLRWRTSGVLATSGRPGRDKGRQHIPTQEDVRTWIEAAQEMGLRTILCLLECRKLEKWYGRVHPKGLLGWYKDEGFAVFHFPAEDRQPVPDDVKKRSLEAFRRASKPVLLQDSGGATRTRAVSRYIVEQLSLRRKAKGA